jgi:hypothetical protein
MEAPGAFNEGQLFDKEGLIKDEVEQQIIVTSEPDLETAKQALSALAKTEEELEAAHTELLTEAEQYLNMLLIQKVLPSEILKMKMPVFIRQQVLKMVAGHPHLPPRLVVD